MPNFPKNEHYLPQYAYQGVRNVRVFGKFGVLCFFETPVLIFAFLAYYRRSVIDIHEWSGLDPLTVC